MGQQLTDRPTTPPHMAERVVEKNQTQYVKNFCLEKCGEKLKYLVWITKEHKKTGKIEDRLFALSACRIMTFKGSGKKLCHNDHIYNLKSLVYRQEKRLELHFEGWFIKFSHSQAVGMLVKNICETINRICCLWPDAAKPKVDANPVLLAELQISPFEATEQNGASGFLATYDGLCSLHSVAQCETFRARVTKAFLNNDHRLCASWHEAKMECGHMQAFAGSILHDKWFTDVSFGGGEHDTIDGAVNSIGPALASVRHLRQLRLCHARLSTKGAQTVVHALQVNHGMQLQVLDLSYNALNATVVKELAVCVARTHTSLQELHLNAVGMTSKGFSSMIDCFMSSEPFLQRGLSVLAVAQNTLGKTGTKKLIEFLGGSGGSGNSSGKKKGGALLKRLDVSAAGIDVALLAQGMLAGTSSLTSISIGENRMTPEATRALCTLLATTTTLSIVNLYSAINSRDERTNTRDRLSLEAVTAALLFNPQLNKTALGLSNNLLGSSYSRKLAAMCRDSRTLVKLDINDCGIGDEALAMLFQGFSETLNPRLEILNVARNSKVNENVGAAKWLVRMIQNAKALKHIDLSGGRDRNVNKGKQLWSLHLHPFFECLKTNSSLEHCNISHNGLTDGDMAVLTNAIAGRTKQQCCLKSIVVRGNNSTGVAVKKLEKQLKKKYVAEQNR